MVGTIDMTDSAAWSIWQATLGQLQLQVTRPSYNTWLKGTVGIALEGDRLVIGTPNTFAAEWLEQRMYQLIRKTVEGITKRPLEILFQVRQKHASWPTPAGPREPLSGGLVPTTSLQEPSALARTLPPHSAHALSDRYTFDSFVVGESNGLAYAAAQAVASYPGLAYNPLFIYAGVGLGKTHLLHAIAHQVTSQRLTCLYVSTEQFTNDFISAIRERTTDAFRTKYRSVDVLLVDDIQFIGGKEQTQEGFFHTFNELHNANRQIVIASDRPPKALPLLEDRLRSRFEWGLITDIQPPALETRQAILHFKADQRQIRIDAAVIELVARKVPNNIREMEGTLNKLVAFAQFTGRSITLSLANQILGDTDAFRRHPPRPQSILEQVARYYTLPIATLTAKRRDKHTATARQVAMYLLREETRHSLKEIGFLLGHRNHATVLYAIRKVHDQLNTNPDLRQDIASLRARLLQADSPYR